MLHASYSALRFQKFQKPKAVAHAARAPQLLVFI
jgi:hypothetical protein